MTGKSLLIYCGHGTYGSDDDAYGAMLLANTALAKGLEVTLVLVDDGVYMAKKGQNPGKIGLPSNLNEIMDFLDLGGKLLVVGEALEERGLAISELADGALVIETAGIPQIVMEHSISVTF